MRSGSNISAVQADSILTEAYPVSVAGTAGERGVGLGLTLYKEFLRLNGGEIWFNSVPGQGTTFYLTVVALAG